MTRDYGERRRVTILGERHRRPPLAPVASHQPRPVRDAADARAYAAAKGWTVSDEHVYADDGVSGAEFGTRPGLLRLMNALRVGRPPFQVLIMSEESRLGREQLETGYLLKQIVQAGVRVFFYLENRERTLDSPTDKIMLSLTTFADELEREKARRRSIASTVFSSECFPCRKFDRPPRRSLPAGAPWTRDRVLHPGRVERRSPALVVVPRELEIVAPSRHTDGARCQPPVQIRLRVSSFDCGKRR
jgi:hypothetical protein